MIRSLRARLLVVWLASLAACAVLGVLFVQLYVDSSTATAARAGIAGLRACDRLADRFAYYAAGWDPVATERLDEATRRGLLSVAQAASSFAGMSVGFWREGEGVVAATPLAPPPSETDSLAEAAAETIAADAPARRSLADTGTLLLACPLHGALRDLVGWVRIVVADTPGLDRLRLGLGILLALVVGISAWLTWLVADWNRRVGAVEAALAGAAGSAALPRTGLRELDRLVGALETAKARLSAAQERAAANERLAALGRVAAGVAHEIRNPAAAMRLRAENALVGEPVRHGAALEAMLGQIDRLDQLIAELLEMTQRREPRPQPVRLPDFLRQHADAAGLPDAVIAADIEAARLDPGMVGRVVAILLDNARRHAEGAAVRLDATREGDRLILRVSDDGPGIASAVRAALFEPFVTGRPDGTGLGLAIARELAEAHGGQLRLVQTPRGAAFRLEVPWQPS